ncbi:hypothetical protein TUM4249_16740 [Shewanella sp. KT0246]|nr:hypothetical protein TUM4249_16740 [Shewanella sp. KT0246]
MLVLYITQKMDVIDQETHLVRLNASMLRYLPWLVKEVILSNISVVKHIWMGNKSISPTLTTIDTRQCSDINKVTYANSITLTPGTVAIDLIDDQITVHALHESDIETLKAGEMDRRVRELEN